MRALNSALAATLIGMMASAQADAPAPARAQPVQPAFIEALIDQRASAARPTELSTLFRLQLAAGKFTDAESTIARLAALHRQREPQRANALAPWRIYARARAYEADGRSKPQAIALAFEELYARLPDREAVELLPFFTVDMMRLRDAQTAAASACAGIAVDRCQSAAELIAARQSVLAWDYLLPSLQPLIDVDLERRFVIERDLLIPTPDGARISAIVIRPRAATAAIALLNFTIYARDDWAVSDAARMAAYGYAGVVAFSRGKAASPGPITPYVHDGDDAVAVIDWIAVQPWSDGRVGMFSGSYNAAVAWGAAKRRPRALRAIATHASNAPGIDTPMRGGVFQNFIYPWPLYTSETRGLDEINYGDRARWNALNRNWYVSGRPYRDLDRIDGQPNPIFRTWLDHPDYDAYWQGMIPFGTEFAKVDIPVLVQTGYYDGGMVGALYYMREHLRHRPDADHRLLLGPYHHTAMTTGVPARFAGRDLDDVARLDLQAVRLQWFDHVFRGTPLPDVLRARINYQVMGSNAWRHASSLQTMATDRLRFYLTGERDGARYVMREGRRARGPAPALAVDFADRTDVDYEGSPTELDTRNGLLFATPPTTRPMELVGAFKARFDVTLNKRDVDLSVVLFELRADGQYTQLASHLVRASYLGDRTRRQLLQPGRTHTLTFESDTLMGHLVERGSRILALVSVPRGQDLQINYGTGGDVSAESVADAGEPLRLTWGAESFIEVGRR